MNKDEYVIYATDVQVEGHTEPVHVELRVSGDAMRAAAERPGLAVNGGVNFKAWSLAKPEQS